MITMTEHDHPTPDTSRRSCPDWCSERRSLEPHGTDHESAGSHVDMPDGSTLFVTLARPQAYASRTVVAVHDGDDPAFAGLTPSAARSLAAGLIAAADRAEGL